MTYNPMVRPRRITTISLSTLTTPGIRPTTSAATVRCGEYEVIGRPYTTAAGKTANVRVKRVDSDVTMIRGLGRARARRGDRLIYPRYSWSASLGLPDEETLDMQTDISPVLAAETRDYRLGLVEDRAEPSHHDCPSVNGYMRYSALL
jgi:hypothetical protein